MECKSLVLLMHQACSSLKNYCLAREDSNSLKAWCKHGPPKHSFFGSFDNPGTTVVSERNNVPIYGDSGRTVCNCYSTGLHCQRLFWQQRQKSIFKVSQN